MAARRYRPPKSSDGQPLPPLDPAVSIIVRHDDAVPITLLNQFHKNPNKGNVKVIRESIAENNLFRSVVVNVGTLTGREYEILAGNHTVLSAEEEGREYVSVDWVDVDNARCVKIMAVDNAAAKKGKIDTDVLSGLLVDLGSLVGTGVTDAELARMVGDEPDVTPQLGDAGYALIIDCEDEDQQAELLTEFEDRDLNVRPLMT